MNPPTSVDQRRYDLDAVRSFAMLLGIFLHAALAYTGGWWWVSKPPGSDFLGITVSGIHGFRMQLFFLLSGFFTAMLWRKRGLAGLLSHRAKRIALPLAFGCATIVPAMFWVSGWAVSQQMEFTEAAAAVGQTTSPESDAAPVGDIWTASASGNLDVLRTFDSESAEIDAPDPNFGVTPLGWAAMMGQPEAAAYLLEIGADPSARYADQNTPLHTACFFGRDEIAELLISAGADLTAQSAAGERPLDALAHNRQTTEFIAALARVSIDFERVKEGREAISDFVEAGSDRAAEGERTTGALWRVLHINFFHHLWFLWHLCIMIAGFALVVSIARLLPGIVIPRRLVALPWCLLWLIPLTMVTQWYMHAEGPGIGPDTTTGIIPAPHVVLYYSTFFGFGAMVYMVRGAGERFAPARSWSYILPSTVPLLFVALTLEYSESTTGFMGNELARNLVSDGVQVVYAWMMNFGFIALFESVLSRERRWVRYLSDSSYWLYLIHLPVVVAGQALLLRSDLGPVTETALLTAAVTAGLLITYHLGVRYTPIGTLLNGKRTRPAKQALHGPIENPSAPAKTKTAP